MISWTLKKDGQVIIEGPIEVIISKVKQIGDYVILSVDILESVIEVVEQSNEFERSELIRKGMKASQLEMFRRHRHYIEDPDYKFCTSCKISRKIENFGYRSDSRDGRATQCKDCVNKKARTNRRKKDE